MEELSPRRTLFSSVFWTMAVVVQHLPVGAVLVGGVGGVGGGAVWLLLLLPVFAGGHPLVDPVQAARLLKVADLPRGRETLNGCGEEEGSTVSRRKPRRSPKAGD